MSILYPLPLFAGLGNASPPSSPRPAAPAAPQRQAAPPPAAARPHRRPAHEQPASSHTPPPHSRHGAAPPPSTSTRTVERSPGPSKRPANRALLGVAAAALTVIVGLGTWALSGIDSKDKPGHTGTVDPKKSSAPPTPSATQLAIRSAEGIDLVGQDGGKGEGKGHLAIDGKTGTTWRSSFYASPEFGNLKKGVGLMLDMGKTVTVNEVKAQVPVSAGATIQLKIGDTASPNSMQKVQTVTTSGGDSVSFQLSSPQTARYVLLWFARISNGSDGRLRAEVGEVSVLGSAS